MCANRFVNSRVGWAIVTWLPMSWRTLVSFPTFSRNTLCGCIVHLYFVASLAPDAAPITHFGASNHTPTKGWLILSHTDCLCSWSMEKSLCATKFPLLASLSCCLLKLALCSGKYSESPLFLLMHSPLHQFLVSGLHSRTPCCLYLHFWKRSSLFQQLFETFHVLFFTSTFLLIISSICTVK